MMICPEGFLEEHKGKAYIELLSVRDELIRSIRAFENDEIPESAYMKHPSPEVIYQCELEYLGELCRLISETYNREVVHSGDDFYEE